jgi:hypothetical protein
MTPSVKKLRYAHRPFGEEVSIKTHAPDKKIKNSIISATAVSRAEWGLSGDEWVVPNASVPGFGSR